MSALTSRKPARRTRRGGAPTLIIASLGILAVGGAGAYFALQRGGAASGVGTTELHRVAKTSFDITVTSSGELEAKQQKEVRSELDSPAAIVELVPEGQKVKKGDVLVRLSSEEIENKLQEETLRVEAARSDYISAKTAYDIQENDNDAAQRKAELDLELKGIELTKFREGDDKKSRDEYLIAIKTAEKERDLKKDQHEKNQRLFERQFASKDEVQQGEIALIRAEAALETAKLDLWIYEQYEFDKRMKELTSNVSEAEAALERTIKQNERQLASKDADRINKKRQLELREENLADLQEQFEACSIVADNDGLVVYASSTGRGRGYVMFGGDGPMQVGRTVRPNELIMILPSTGQMVAAVRVHESVAGRIQPGQPATIRVEALQGRTFPGKVDSVSVLAESDPWRDPNTREYTVKVLLDPLEEDGPSFKPAMRAEAQILLGEVDESLAIPIQAVFRDGAVAFAYTPKGGKFERTPVRTGRRSATTIEVLAGLDEGQQVLLREPTPGEVLDTKWDEATLAAMAPQGMQDMMRGGRGRPANVSAPGEGGAPQGMTVTTTGGPGGPGGNQQVMKLDPNDPKVKEMIRKARESGNMKMVGPGGQAAPAEGGAEKPAEAPAKSGPQSASGGEDAAPAETAPANKSSE